VATAQSSATENPAELTTAGSSDRSGGGISQDLLLENCLKTHDPAKRFQFNSSISSIKTFWDFPKYEEKIRSIAMNPMWQDEISAPGFSSQIKVLIRKIDTMDQSGDVPDDYRDIEKVLEDVVEIIEDRNALSRRMAPQSEFMDADESWKQHALDQLDVDPPNDDSEDATMADKLPEDIVICEFGAGWEEDIEGMATVQSMTIGEPEGNESDHADVDMEAVQVAKADDEASVDLLAAGSGNRSGGEVVSAVPCTSALDTSLAQASERDDAPRPFDVFTKDLELIVKNPRRLRDTLKDPDENLKLADHFHFDEFDMTAPNVRQNGDDIIRALRMKSYPCLQIHVNQHHDGLDEFANLLFKAMPSEQGPGRLVCSRSMPTCITNYALARCRRGKAQGTSHD
jgi:hypothetical protein